MKIYKESFSRKPHFFTFTPNINISRTIQEQRKFTGL